MVCTSPEPAPATGAGARGRARGILLPRGQVSAGAVWKQLLGQLLRANSCLALQV